MSSAHTLLEAGMPTSPTEAWLSEAVHNPRHLLWAAGPIAAPYFSGLRVDCMSGLPLVTLPVPLAHHISGWQYLQPEWSSTWCSAVLPPACGCMCGLEEVSLLYLCLRGQQKLHLEDQPCAPALSEGLLFKSASSMALLLLLRSAPHPWMQAAPATMLCKGCLERGGASATEVCWYGVCLQKQQRMAGIAVHTAVPPTWWADLAGDWEFNARANHQGLWDDAGLDIM